VPPSSAVDPAAHSRRLPSLAVAGLEPASAAELGSTVDSAHGLIAVLPSAVPPCRAAPPPVSVALSVSR